MNPKAIENVVVEDHKQQECGLQQGVMGLPEIREQVRQETIYEAQSMDQLDTLMQCESD